MATAQYIQELTDLQKGRAIIEQNIADLGPSEYHTRALADIDEAIAELQASPVTVVYTTPTEIYQGTLALAGKTKADGIAAVRAVSLTLPAGNRLDEFNEWLADVESVKNTEVSAEFESVYASKSQQSVSVPTPTSPTLDDVTILVKQGLNMVEVELRGDTTVTSKVITFTYSGITQTFGFVANQTPAAVISSLITKLKAFATTYNFNIDIDSADGRSNALNITVPSGATLPTITMAAGTSFTVAVAQVSTTDRWKITPTGGPAGVDGYEFILVWEDDLNDIHRATISVPSGNMPPAAGKSIQQQLRLAFPDLAVTRNSAGLVAFSSNVSSITNAFIQPATYTPMEIRLTGASSDVILITGDPADKDGTAAISIELADPYYGRWYADVEVDEDETALSVATQVRAIVATWPWVTSATVSGDANRGTIQLVLAGNADISRMDASIFAVAPVRDIDVAFYSLEDNSEGYLWFTGDPDESTVSEVMRFMVLDGDRVAPTGAAVGWDLNTLANLAASTAYAVANISAAEGFSASASGNVVTVVPAGVNNNLGNTTVVDDELVRFSAVADSPNYECAVLDLQLDTSREITIVVDIEVDSSPIAESPIVLANLPGGTSPVQVVATLAAALVDATEVTIESNGDGTFTVEPAGGASAVTSFAWSFDFGRDIEYSVVKLTGITTAQVFVGPTNSVTQTTHRARMTLNGDVYDFVIPAGSTNPNVTASLETDIDALDGLNATASGNSLTIATEAPPVIGTTAGSATGTGTATATIAIDDGPAASDGEAAITLTFASSGAVTIPTAILTEADTDDDVASIIAAALDGVDGVDASSTGADVSVTATAAGDYDGENVSAFTVVITGGGGSAPIITSLTFVDNPT